MNDASPDAVRPVGIGVIGANSFVANAAVMPAIDAVDGAFVAATASSSAAVPGRWASTAVPDYEAVLAHPDVEAVYIPLPNGMHRQWTERAAATGKHVLCEKPLAPDAMSAEAMVQACASADVLLAEAYMTPFHRRYDHALQMVRAGAVGRVVSVDARFTFTIGPDASDNYRWSPDQGGGALLDVGIYCLGPIVELLGAAPERIEGGSDRAATGVDAATHAILTYPDRRHGSIHCSFVDDEQQYLAIVGTAGRIRLDTQAFTGGDDDATMRLAQPADTGADDVTDSVRTISTNDPYQHMVQAFADAVRGRREWPRPVERSVEMIRLIERIAEATR